MNEKAKRVAGWVFAGLVMVMIPGAVWYERDQRALDTHELQAIVKDAAGKLNARMVSRVTYGQLNATRTERMAASMAAEIASEVPHQIEHAALRKGLPIPAIEVQAPSNSVRSLYTVSADGNTVCLDVDARMRPKEGDTNIEFETTFELQATIRNEECGRI